MKAILAIENGTNTWRKKIAEETGVSIYGLNFFVEEIVDETVSVKISYAGDSEVIDTEVGEAHPFPNSDWSYSVEEVLTG